MKQDLSVIQDDSTSSVDSRRTVPIIPDPTDDFVAVAVLASAREVFAVPRSAMVTIVPLQGVVFCRNAPEWLLGMTQIGGQWIVVVAITTWLRGRAADVRPGSKLAVVTIGGGRALGLCIDSAVGFRDLYNSEVDKYPSGANLRAADLVRGITEDGLTLLDLERIFVDEALSPERMRSYFFEG